MKEILSFHRYLTRKQKQLLVLFILVLIPIGSWAESMTKTYTFTGSTKTEKEGGGYCTNFQSAEGITWKLNDATYSYDLNFGVGYGQAAFMGATLTSVDEFYTVNKIVFDIDLSEEAIEYANTRWVTFKCGQIETMVDNTTLGMDPDEDGVVLEMDKFTPNGLLSIEIEGYGYEITLHSIKVVYERDNLGLYFYYNAGSITEWSLNWSDCRNNNVYIPPLYDYTDDDTQFPVVFTSSNENVVTIDDTGVYSLVGPGQTTVTATFGGNTQYNPESVSYTLTINDDRPPLSQCRAELDPDSREYNRGRQSTVMRIYSPEGAPLVEGTDFSVSQSDNMVNAGSYIITATALPYGSYSGQLTATYTITPVSLDNAVITLSPTSLVYDGTAKEPAVSVAFMNQKTNELETPLTAGTDYTVSYSNNTNVTDGATVTVTGKDNYTGTKTATFSITKAAGSISYATTSITKTYGDAVFTNELKKTGDGTVAYKSSKTEVATVNASTGAVTIVGNGTTTITATVTDGTNYTYATKTATYSLTVNTATMSVTASGYTGTYDGKAHGITVSALEGATVKYGTTSGTYDLTASPTYINVGTYPVYYQVTKTGYTTITGSKTVTIGKAAPIVIAPTAKKLTYTGQAQELVGAGSATGGTMLYSMDGQNYSTTIPTGTTAQEYIIYFKVVGDNNHTDVEANSITSIIVDNSTKYDLWIGTIQVSDLNRTDILSDGRADQGKTASFQYIPNLNKLFITNSRDDLIIKTTNNEGLTVYLAPNSANDVGNIIYTGNGNAPLTITTDGNYPGTVSLSANSNVISGFSSLTLEQSLVIMSPEDIAYDASNRRLGTTNATIGALLAPITEEKTIVPKGDELQPESGSTDINKVVDDILYTLGNANDSNGDGYDDGGFIVINSVTTDHQAVRVTQNYTPGTNEYLEGFKGLTFMIPAGKGKIAFNVQTSNGHAMKVMVGDAAPVIVESTEKGTVEIPYNVAEPTYVYAYNAGVIGNANSARSVQKGKMTTVHIKIYGTTVKPNKIKSANSAAEASGGEYQGEIIGLEGQDIETDEEIEASKGDVNGDETINAADVAETVNAIMGDHSTMFDKRAADPNGDGVINTADIVIIVNKIINP